MTDSMAKYEAMRRNGGVPPQEITDDRFWYLLGVMPPLNWVRNGIDESFAILEAETFNLHTHCVRIYSTHYELVCPIGTKHSDLVKLCMPLFKEAHEKRMQAVYKVMAQTNQASSDEKSQKPEQEPTAADQTPKTLNAMDAAHDKAQPEQNPTLTWAEQRAIVAQSRSTTPAPKMFQRVHPWERP
jgi:hypothetical protein